MKTKSRRPKDLGNFACDGCGSCCVKFFLSYSPDELLEMYRSAVSTRGKLRLYLSDKEQFRTDSIPEEIELVYPMVRFIEPVKDTANTHAGFFYSCVHYDKKTHKCGIHAIRPRMCRAFPFYGGKRPSFPAKLYPKCQFVHLVEEVGKMDEAGKMYMVKSKSDRKASPQVEREESWAEKNWATVKSKKNKITRVGP